jgi:hypothetical protein
VDEAPDNSADREHAAARRVSAGTMLVSVLRSSVALADASLESV